ncbi:enoyl-CoA hydratase-related protein [Streptomyces sp. NPDC048270]|uniref:enoyl-CoA hydratase-related protein n=1 Tax=Streptomyces sp. NPDC048270 TaxID=3154615 RepID=UPI0033F2D4C5
MELTGTAPGPSGHRTLRVEHDRGRLTVTLTRPAERNSITRELITDLGAALDLAERTEDCRVVVLRAEGDTFCSGMDLSGVAAAGAGAPAEGADDRRADGTAGGPTGGTAGGPAGVQDTRKGGEDYFALLERLTTIGRIVVAQVDGHAVGGGVGLVAASDFVHATDRSRFSLPEALWGLLPCSVLPFLIRRVGFQRAYAMALGTLPVAAREAAVHGLVDELAEDPGPALRRLLFRASKLDPATVADLKRYTRRLWILDEHTQRTAVDEFVRLMSSDRVRGRIAGFADLSAGTGRDVPPAAPR